MANKKITDLVEITSAANVDVLPIVDVSADVTNKIKVENLPINTATQTALDAKQATLVSGTNIKTINSTSLLGSGDIAIAANPAGTAGQIQFSDGSAFAADSNLYWDNTNKRLGVGETTPTARVHIKGSGSTSATTSLLVQNSSSLNLFSVRDDGQVILGTDTDVRVTSGQQTTFRYGVSVGTLSAPNASAIIDATSTTKGFLPPRMTTTQKNAIASPAAGLQLWDTDKSSLQLTNGTDWLSVGFGAGGVGTNSALGNGALAANTTGVQNTALGSNALNGCTTGGNNVAIGRESLGFGNPQNSTAVGSESLRGGAHGAVAIGRQSQRNTTGVDNVSVGNISLSTNTTGQNNTAIGTNTQSGNFSGSVILGKDATATASNQFVIGSATYNAGTIDANSFTQGNRWKVKINGTDYWIPLELA